MPGIETAAESINTLPENPGADPNLLEDARPPISYEIAPLSVDLCEHSHLIIFEDATHWVLQDEPEATSTHLVQPFSKEPTLLIRQLMNAYPEYLEQTSLGVFPNS